MNGLLALLVEAVGSNEADGSDEAVGLASSASDFDSSG